MQENQLKYLEKYTLIRKAKENKEVMYIRQNRKENGSRHIILIENGWGDLEARSFTEYDLNKDKELNIKNPGTLNSRKCEKEYIQNKINNKTK